MSYQKFGYGLYLVQLKHSKEAVGICGLLKREYLDAPDIGYAFLERYRNQGLATESISAVLDYYKRTSQFNTILAMVSEENDVSVRILKKFGFSFKDKIDVDGRNDTSHLYELSLTHYEKKVF